MKKILPTFVSSALILSSMIGSAMSQDSAKNPPVSSQKDDSNLCNNAPGGTVYGGFVTSVAPTWSGNTNIAITFKGDTNPNTGVWMYSSFKLDTDPGGVVYSALMTALVSGMHTQIYCNGDGTFGSVNIGG